MSGGWVKKMRRLHQKAVNDSARGKATSALRQTATGVITYIEDGKQLQWSVGCMARETSEHMKKHLSTWRPKAQFVSAEIIPDKRQND